MTIHNSTIDGRNSNSSRTGNNYGNCGVQNSGINNHHDDHGNDSSSGERSRSPVQLLMAAKYNDSVIGITANSTEVAKMRGDREQAYFNSYDFDAITKNHRYTTAPYHPDTNNYSDQHFKEFSKLEAYDDQCSGGVMADARREVRHHSGALETSGIDSNRSHRYWRQSPQPVSLDYDLRMTRGDSTRRREIGGGDLQLPRPSLIKYNR